MLNFLIIFLIKKFFTFDEYVSKVKISKHPIRKDKYIIKIYFGTSDLSMLGIFIDKLSSELYNELEKDKIEFMYWNTGYAEFSISF
uniref:Uncharacterized protein n=1 Tax=viral metagenome TaxID=1070528 RepID=A0A6C0AED4_9ZZZZ